MGYDPSVCIQKLNAAGLTPACEALANPYHCDDLQQISPVIHQFCGQQQAYYAPVQALVCIYYNNNVPTQWLYWPADQLIVKCMQQVPQKGTGTTGWNVANCYCCCSCFAYNTMIAVPDGMVAIQEIKIGNEVRAAKLVNGKPQWDNKAVTFSSGMAGGDSPAMVYIHYGDNPTDLICNSDQVFVLSTGEMVRAGKLTIDDKLMGEDGAAVPIHMVALGNYKGGIHHISTGNEWKGSADGHLLLAAGVVAGDFTLQMHFDSLGANLKVKNASLRHEIGSADYAKQHSKLRSGKALLAFSSNGHEPAAHQLAVQNGRFQFYRLAGPDYTTMGVSMFTPEQANDILENGQQLALSNPVPKSEIANIFMILKGFYPEFNYYLDWYAMEPNVHAFEEYGQKFVVVTGGLARMVGLSYEGLMMAVAHGVSRFIGLPPKTPSGYVGTGAADYFGFGVISRAIWYGNSWINSVMPAFTQIQALMGLISPANAGGVPGYPVEYPSISCRLSAIQSGMGGGPLPECCGGPPVPMIGVQSATAEPGGVAITFTYAPIEQEAINVANYATTPSVSITKATVDPEKNFIVHLEAAFKAGTDYKVTVSNLHNIFGGGVDPKADSATFTAI
ncbi:hedgehog/intein hint domain-containing protein [Bradyrhizobium oligotrophicum S58]|uniref:Hedgehog/intein hint domain-containing protein n=1 Tax=Bradyrhizobium oligotrophicum S58 TaxID=1245469 RepID=M4ZF39_9BRAD|nr:hypothetical protein [Bradyrhizobium oligotrophicum]BAM92467.1 hedgehog/intein hint domain-containing protein [Bradyrhizobium oligotrophicum S58]